MDATNATDLIKVGKVPEPGDKSEDLPKIHSLAFAPRIGRVRQMSETVSDSTEPKRSYSPCSRKWKSACGVEIVCRFLTPINNRLNRIVTELLFESNTCLIAALGLECSGLLIQETRRLSGEAVRFPHLIVNTRLPDKYEKNNHHCSPCAYNGGIM